MKKARASVARAEPLQFQRADPAALTQFDPATKSCTMNCGQHKDDLRSDKERKFLCGDCLTVAPREKEDGMADIGEGSRHYHDQKAIERLEQRVKELGEEVERLRHDCGEAYQVVGVLVDALGLDEDAQCIKALDNLSAAANGEPRPHDDLLPFTAEAKA